ncbi:putative 26S proteasome regulatory subunit p27 [Candida tropicalis]|nr:PDZ domain-containing protein [Asgard group archaeon]
MTVDEHDLNDSSFTGLMQTLNLDPIEFKEYKNINSRLTFQELEIIKQDIEKQLNILFDLLNHKYNCDMNTSLITSDGYPRNDIDVVSIRLIRVRIIRLKNDYKLILELIDDKMSQEFAQRQIDNPIGQDVEEEMNDSQSRRTIEYTIPFARVAEVVNGGPAFKAGLKENDEILLFDHDIHASNNNRLRNLVTRVKIGKTIPVEIKRNQNEKVSLNLIPSDDWDGQGLLGCRLLPI